MPKPLAGLRVLELARILAGPWAGQMLADLGADVIKVERKGAGDDTRVWGPPFVQGVGDKHIGSAYFHSANRGKRSIEADFESRGRPAHRAQAGETLGRADREFQSRRARQIRPRLREPHAGKSAADLLLGDRLRPGRALRAARRLRPHGARHGRHHGPDRHARTASRRASASRCPTSSPASIRWSASSRRCTQREQTGKGCYVDTALVDSTVGVLSNQALNYLVSGNMPKRIGNAHANIVPYQVFPVADGHVIIATGNDTQYVKLCNVLGAPELAGDPAYKDNVGRLKHRDELIGKISALTVAHEARRTARQARRDAGAGRADQQSRAGVRRPAGQAPRHEARTAERRRQGRHHPRRAHADRDRRLEGGERERPRRCSASTRRRSCARSAKAEPAGSALPPARPRASPGRRGNGDAALRDRRASAARRRRAVPHPGRWRCSRWSAAPGFRGSAGRSRAQARGRSCRPASGCPRRPGRRRHRARSAASAACASATLRT